MKRTIITRHVEARVIALSRDDNASARRAFWLKVGLVLMAVAIFVLAGTYSAGAASAGSSPVFPSILPLPNGWQPEGIATGRGTDFYVGSLADGAIYKGDLRTGDGTVLTPGVAGRAITGIKVDNRTNYVFASGAFAGDAFIFDATTGALLREYQLATAMPSFINDVVITRDAAYFTDSFQAFIYKLPLGPGGSLPDQSQVERIPLSGDFQQVPGPGVFNANGIDATSDGKTLIIVQSVTGMLFTVDPASGVAAEIDLGGGSVPNGDGILLDGKTLYVVRNQDNEIVVIDLDLKTNSGAVVDTIKDSDFHVPTTVANFGKWLYAVNAYFGQPNPTGQFEVVQVRR